MADINSAAPPPQRKLSLASAASRSDAVAVQRILNEGADVDKCDSDGFTALHRACAIGDEDVVDVLLKNGASPDLADACGDTALHWACFCGHIEAVDTLLRAGADATIRSTDGKTPLDAARDEGHISIVRLLAAKLGVAGEGSVAGSARSESVGSRAPTATNQDMAPLIEGALKKKSKNKVLGSTMWRTRYFALSASNCGMFVWLGAEKTTMDDEVKFFPFENFLWVRQNAPAADARKFCLKLVSSRLFELQAESVATATQWVAEIKTCGGRSMATTRIQTAYRRYRNMKKFEKQREIIRKEISMAMQVVQTGGAGGDLEGNLKKHDHKGVKGITKRWRTRYFVLSRKEAKLKYFDNKTKRG